MKIPIRFFSIGLLTASSFLLIIYLVIGNNEASADDIPIEELISTLESEGYRAITEDDFISYSVYLDEQKEQEEQNEQTKEPAKKESEQKEVNKDDENNEQEKEEETEEVKSINFTIEQGMVSQDIAKILIGEGMLDSEEEFVNYLENNNYSPYIQIGSFTIKSDMSLKEIAETITTYPGN